MEDRARETEDVDCDGLGESKGKKTYEHYRVERNIGHGTYGSVKLATSVRNGGKVGRPVSSAADKR